MQKIDLVCRSTFSVCRFACSSHVKSRPFDKNSFTSSSIFILELHDPQHDPRCRDSEDSSFVVDSQPKFQSSISTLETAAAQKQSHLDLVLLFIYCCFCRPVENKPYAVLLMKTEVYVNNLFKSKKYNRALRWLVVKTQLKFIQCRQTQRT